MMTYIMLSSHYIFNERYQHNLPALFYEDRAGYSMHDTHYIHSYGDLGSALSSINVI